MHSTSSARIGVIATFSVVLMLMNVNCGEYLLLDYLVGPGGVLAVVPPEKAEPTPEAVMEVTPPEEPPPVYPVPQPTPVKDRPEYPKGDLNEDGVVDGLDVQVMVEILMSQ